MDRLANQFDSNNIIKVYQHNKYFGKPSLLLLDSHIILSFKFFGC